MRKLLITTIIAIFIFAPTVLYAQQTIRSDSVSPFHSITSQGNLSVELIASDSNRVEIALDENADIAKFKWGVDKEVLSFTLRAGKGSGSVKIYYADTLKYVSMSGGELKTANTIESKIFRIFASGGAKLTVEIESLDAEMEITGNSAALATGEVKYLDIRATEKSTVDTRELYAMAVNAEAATGAEVYLSVDERLIANSKSSSTIFYKGKPVVLKNITSRMSSGMMGSSVLNIGD